MTKISVVIPTFNEEKRIEKTIEKIVTFFRNARYDFEVIICDDGSIDKTPEIAKSLQKKYSNLILLPGQHKGKGLTVKAGMEKAQGEIVLFTDADLATPISEFAKFQKKFAEGAEIVIGSRGLKREGAPLIRWIMAWGLNFLARVFLGLKFSDTQCGFKAFRKNTLEQILTKMRIYSKVYPTRGPRVSASFDLELLFLAKVAKFKIREIRVLWEHKRSQAVRPVTESMITLLDILKIRINNLFGRYSNVS